MAERSRDTHETTLTDTPPTPEQLSRLVGHALASAHRTNMLRSASFVQNTHYYVQEIEAPNNTIDSLLEDFPMRVRHRLGMRIGELSVNETTRLDTLQVHDSVKYEQQDGHWSGVRTIHRFEWSADETTVAARHVKLLSYKSKRSLYDELETFWVPDDIAARFYAEQEMTQVTADDCDELIADVTDFYGQEKLFLSNKPSS